jgi:SAM-dependent methyltransferase
VSDALAPNEERLEELLQRLERERADADRQYNDALTALDRSLQLMPALPDPPPPYDDRQIEAINQHWDILPDGAPAVDRSLKGRLRGFIWRLVGGALERQRGFNAALVDHLNRNVTAHREAARALTTLTSVLRDQLEGLVTFQHLLIGYLQTITLYVDTRNRAAAGQAQILNAAIGALTDDWLKRWESLAAREQRFQARVAAMDRSIGELQPTVALAQQLSLTLKRELERLRATGAAPGAPSAESAPPDSARSPDPAATDLDSFKYLGFEDAFRGSRDEIRSRLADYVRHFEGAADVLDVGCGRGEFLDLLRDHGITGRGLDLNHEMVEVARARGLEVVEADALSYLTTLDDASLGGLFAAQVVEHLKPDYLMRLIETACHKIRPGGAIVLETINPACWAAFFDSFIRDLTHERPLHPETLQYLVRVSGFHDVAVEFKSPFPESARLRRVPPAEHDGSALLVVADTVNENVDKLNARLFTHQDYAVIGRR